MTVECRARALDLPLANSFHTLGRVKNLNRRPDEPVAGPIRLLTEQEVIAQSSSFFGLFKTSCESPITGTIETLSTVTGQALLEHLVIGVRWRGHELDVVLLQSIPAGVQIVASEGDMLYSLAIEVHEVFFDLAGAF